MMAKLPRQPLSYALTIVLFSCLCISLYIWNNKYTHNPMQPEHGQLTVTEDALTDYHFLIADWEFYPDTLLTPQTYPDDYMYYTDIGERTRFDSTAHPGNPHGSGSYALHLNLPEESHVYALELPEIFSAYKLYINDKLVAQAGNPEPDNYSSATKSQIVTFEATGDVTLLLAVTDHSHFYSGLVYPPIFGEFSKVNTLHNIRLSFTLIASTIGLLFTLFYAYFGIRTKNISSIHLAALCLLMCLTPLFPILHSLWELPVFPWYALELLSIYGMMLLVILLHNKICKANYYSNLISSLIAGIFCIMAGCYGLFSAYLTVPVMKLFSTCLFCYKLSFAAYLFLTAGISLHQRNESSRPVFYASLGYACFYVWDRILPDFEPILYGWFADWGNLIMTCAIGYTLWSDLTNSYINSITFEEENRQVKKQLSLLKTYTQTLDEQLSEKLRLTHDFRHRLRIISETLTQLKTDSDTPEAYDTLLEYISEISRHTASHTAFVPGTFSSIPMLDALMYCYHSMALEQQIHIEIHFSIPEPAPLTVDELIRVISNLLENAIEACNRLSDEESKHITLSTHNTGEQWFLMVENTYDNIVFQKNNHFISRKNPEKQRFGVGLESVREIVSSHGGETDIMPMEHTFRVGIMLPLSHS